jgi:hypothetical protein
MSHAYRNFREPPLSRLPVVYLSLLPLFAPDAAEITRSDSNEFNPPNIFGLAALGARGKSFFCGQLYT